jgi:GH43 family beta-xylosidase
MKKSTLLLTLALAITLCGSALLHAETPANAPAEFPLTLADIRVRDPFILPEGGMYYLYAQGGNRAHNDNGDFGVEVYKSRDLVHWSQPKQVFVRPKEGFWGNPPIWAPEVHKLDGAYYMFATFAGRAGGRGSQILRAESPEGPFLMAGDQANTPPEQRCLDGTPWIDPDGTHWMIYCHEWEQVGDGGMLAVKMSKDWSARLGDPITLFHSSQAPWVRAYPKPDTYVTDGPFLHRMKNGKLVMIWSSFVKGHGYGLGQAISESGTVVGPWGHMEKPLVGGAGEDGGHAMILRDISGGLLLVFHQPNRGDAERAKIYRLQEDGDLLVVDGPWVPKANTAASSTAGENPAQQSPNSPMGGAAELKPIPFEDQTPDGLLKARAELSFRRLQEPYFQWDNVSRVNFGPFPGDAALAGAEPA